MYLVKNVSRIPPTWLVMAYWSKYTTSILKISKRIVIFLKKWPSILEGVLTNYVHDQVLLKYVHGGVCL